VSFGGFDCCFLFLVGGARNNLRTWLHSPQPGSNPALSFSPQNSFLKASTQIGNLLLKLGILFGSMEKTV
jgi:hypothetical protein